MKILLDECVPWPMHRLLGGHVCTSVQAQGWSGIRNSDLLQRAEAEFDLFITADQNIRYQQNLAGRRIAILEISTNDLRRIQAAPWLQTRQEKYNRARQSIWLFRKAKHLSCNPAPSADRSLLY